MEKLTDTSRLCLHTITTKPWSLAEAIEAYAAAGVAGITVWRDALDGQNPELAGRLIRAAGLDVVSLCRGGFFASPEETIRRQAIVDNRTLLEEAAGLGAPHVVLVCGSAPDQPLSESRRQIRIGIETLLPYAEEWHVKLAVEPLHPMYADTRSAINTLGAANELCAAIDSPWLGVAVDVYHLWWDPDLEIEIRRAETMNTLLAFHICDWKTPTVDMLNDRGVMGEGCIPIRRIRSWMERSGFRGFNEVEIFSSIRWQQDQAEYLQDIIKAYFQAS